MINIFDGEWHFIKMSWNDVVVEIQVDSEKEIYVFGEKINFVED